MARTFLLEIGTEEIPARFMEPALIQLKDAASEELRFERLSHGEIKTFGTPRRLVLLVDALAEGQLEIVEKKKGPAKKAAYDNQGNPTPAALGFARGQGIEAGELFTEAVDGVEYVFAARQTPAQAAGEVLQSVCIRLLSRLSFPKPMFWYSREIRFARPIRWLTALYGSEVVCFEFAGLSADRKTYGHRFLAPEARVLPSADDYLQAMADGAVVVDQKERRAMIAGQVTSEAVRLGGRTSLDEELLDEVVYLVEYPRAVAGNFNSDYLEIPPEALITVMRTHQRYFPVFDANDSLLPHFITISNGTSDEFTYNVRAGNERVLRARLADARFFFDEDRKVTLESHVEALDKILFMEQLGSMRKKTERLAAITKALAAEIALPMHEVAAAVRAAALCKADLVTHMVYEFPELQGTMGGYYARLSGEDSAVAVAISEHYAPRYAGDTPAVTPAGAVVAVSDKLDTLVSCFGLGLIPSGSQDPYALRRSALGIVSTLALHNFNISLSRLVSLGLAELSGSISRPGAEVLAGVHDFLLSRVRYMFAEEGLRYDVIDAALGSSADDLPGLSARARVLQRKLETPELTSLLTPFTRASNLVRNACAHTPDPSLFVSDAEQKLYAEVTHSADVVKNAAAGGDYEAVFTALAALQQPIDNFFTEVMVMVEDKAVRNNRLALLQQIKTAFLTLGDLSKIVQEKK
ncbi:MAG: glycine--tRNA ligase subunit beta [Dethiobacter sp.]|jgi:glycyl-tRNA synthetase beta chain|nr:glycine--tRNA ligase subunit beta [Dethiobacter sp.]